MRSSKKGPVLAKSDSACSYISLLVTRDGEFEQPVVEPADVCAKYLWTREIQKLMRQVTIHQTPPSNSD